MGLASMDHDRKPLDEETARKYKEAEQFRRFAFVGVVFSTIAIAITIVSVPMIYNYVQTVQSVLQSEMDFCKSRSGDLWMQMFKLKVIKGVPIDDESTLSLGGQLAASQNERFKRQPDSYGTPGPNPGTSAAPVTPNPPLPYPTPQPPEPATSKKPDETGECMLTFFTLIPYQPQ